MKFRSLLAAAVLPLLMPAPASADLVEYEFFKTPEWTIVEQFVDNSFDSCAARRLQYEGSQRFSIGRTITGSDFVLIEGIEAYVDTNDQNTSGKVFINGKTGYDFANQPVRDHTAVPGTKFATMYLSDGFIDNLSSANFVTVQFPKGTTKHGLKGSKNVISRLNACMESALNREMGPVVPLLAAPSGWTAGNSDQGQGGRYIVTELPPLAGAAFGQKLFFAYAENGQGRIDIRIRDSAQAAARRIDPGSTSARRIAASVSLNNQPAFTSMITYEGTAIDVLDVAPADVAKLSLAGPLTIQSLEANAKDRVDISFSADAAMGAASMQGTAASGALTLQSLAGKYWVRGRNPDGKPYTGSAETVMENGTLRINWTWRNKKTDTGQANLVANLLTAVVTGLNDPVLFKIGSDGVWRGTWNKGQGLEWFVPQR